MAGLAPRANDSGYSQGYRRTGHEREGVKPMRFLSAMAARNSNPELKHFYEQLIKSGKTKMVALTALMRNIIVIDNAKLRDFLLQENPLEIKVGASIYLLETWLILSTKTRYGFT